MSKYSAIQTEAMVDIIKLAFSEAQNALDSAKYNLIRRVREQVEDEEEEPDGGEGDR